MEGHDEWCLQQGGHGRQTLYSAGGTVLATVVGRQFERERESGGFERKRECGREKGNVNGQPDPVRRISAVVARNKNTNPARRSSGGGGSLLQHPATASSIWVCEIWICNFYLCILYKLYIY